MDTPKPYDPRKSNRYAFIAALGNAGAAGISGGWDAFEQQLTGGLASAGANAVAKAAGPISGALLGPIAGGVIQLLLGSIFGKPKAIEHPEPTPVKITNVVDFIRMFTLPQSAFFSPTGNGTNPLQLSQTNNFNFNNPGPKTAGRVANIITDGTLANQLDREFA